MGNSCQQEQAIHVIKRWSLDVIKKLHCYKLYLLKFKFKLVLECTSCIGIWKNTELKLGASSCCCNFTLPDKTKKQLRVPMIILSLKSLQSVSLKVHYTGISGPHTV